VQLTKSLELRIPPVALVLLWALSMWLARQAAPLPGLRLALPRALAAALLVGGLAIALAAITAFWRARTTVNPSQPHAATRLVHRGIFRLTRNPMYLGLVLALFAWGVYLGHALALVLVPAFVLYLDHFQIRPEERALAGLFGKEYVNYQQQVRRWL
jgi:protein-S-isoprenylcysteine O-methyltransferase Ste14